MVSWHFMEQYSINQIRSFQKKQKTLANDGDSDETNENHVA